MSVRLHILARVLEWLGLERRAACVRAANERRSQNGRRK